MPEHWAPAPWPGKSPTFPTIPWGQREQGCRHGQAVYPTYLGSSSKPSWLSLDFGAKTREGRETEGGSGVGGKQVSEKSSN